MPPTHKATISKRHSKKRRIGWRRFLLRLPAAPTEQHISSAAVCYIAGACVMTAAANETAGPCAMTSAAG